VRWQHPELGLVQRRSSIALAEETGLIVPISEWVLRTACARNRAWQDAGAALHRSRGEHIGQAAGPRRLVGLVRQVLDESGLEPEFLDLELTESTLCRTRTRRPQPLSS